MKMIANHGQNKKYYHKLTGCNSRLDSIQAAILNVKLKYLDQYNLNRLKMAEKYDEAFNEIKQLTIPHRSTKSNHVFHQYTLKTDNKIRNKIIEYLANNNVPAMIYYPVPLYKQEAFSKFVKDDFKIDNVEKLCDSVFSLPIHSEIENSHQDQIIDTVIKFFKK